MPVGVPSAETPIVELIRAGARGEAVRDVQHRLLGADLRIDVDELDGTFGPSTQAAVRAFQQARGLPADGIVGADTWAQLVEAGYRLGDRTLYLRSPAFRGDDVRELQRMLNALGFDAGKQDGVFGPRTADGVREFQRNVASRVDGIVGLDTVRAVGRYRPSPQGPSRAVVREGEAARGPGMSLAGATVAIDAELGDADPNDLAFAIAKALALGLERLGARPLLLRGAGETPAPAVRIRRANAARAAIVISIGFGSPGPGPAGAACFHFGTPTTYSPLGRRLARSIHQTLVDELGSPNRGVHPLAIPILRETRMPAVRVEPAVLTGTGDAAGQADHNPLAPDPQFVERVASAITRGVRAFSGPAADPSAADGLASSGEPHIAR